MAVSEMIPVKRMLAAVGKVRVHLPALAVLTAANVLLYHDYWFANKVFTGKDFLTSFYPLLNFQTDCLQEFSWPLWNPFMNFGYPFVEHYANTALFPTHLFMGLFTGSTLTAIHWELLVWILIGGFGIYLCVREFGHSALAGIISGISFMFCGQMLMVPQWSLIVYNAACFPYLVLGYHRSTRSDTPFSLLSILFLALPILGGYISTMVYGIYIFAGYVIIDSALRRRAFHGIKYLASTYAGAALLSLPKIVPLYYAMHAGPRIGSYAPTPDLFNIVNFHNFPSLLLPVKFYFSLYLGGLSIIAFVYGILRKQITVNALLILAALTGWLFMVDSDGSVSFLRSLSYVLPLMKTVRNEWLNWYYPSIFVILYLSRFVDGFLWDGAWKLSLAAVVVFVVLLTVVFVSEYSSKLYFTAYGIHAALAFLWFIASLLKERRSVQIAFSLMVITAEFFLVFNRVSVDAPPIRHGDHLQVRITHQVGASQSFRDDVLVSQWFTGWMTDDRRRPSVSESRNWPFLISGLGGAPGYNMFPEQYSMFIDAMNFKKFSGWWHNTQERFEFMKVKDSPLLMQLDGAPLFEYYDRSTREPVGNAATLDEITCSRFSFTLNAGVPGFLLLNQMYDDRWNVLVDGIEQRLYPANEFFMGVEVDAGQHAVTFLFRDKTFSACLAVSSLVFVSLLAVWVRMHRRRTDAEEKRPAAHEIKQT